MTFQKLRFPLWNKKFTPAACMIGILIKLASLYSLYMKYYLVSSWIWHIRSIMIIAWHGDDLHITGSLLTDCWTNSGNASNFRYHDIHEHYSDAVRTGVGISGLPTSKILFPYFVEKISVFWVTFPYPLICSSPDSKLNFLFTLVGSIHSQWKL